MKNHTVEKLDYWVKYDDQFFGWGVLWNEIIICICPNETMADKLAEVLNFVGSHNTKG